MSKLKIMVIAFLAVVLAVAFIVMPGCKNSTATTENAETTVVAETTTTAVAETTEAGKKIEKIGYSPLTSQFEYFQRVILGMKQGCSDIGAELLLDDPQNKLDKQITGLENLLTAGAQSLVICCLDPVAVESVVNEAKSKDIFVVSHVSTFKGADTYVGLDEYNFGLAGGEAFAKEVSKYLKDKKLVVANLNSDTLGEGLVQRNKGELDGLKKTFPDANIVANSTAYDEATALSTVETMLQANPDINVVVCTNDPSAYGAIDAIESAGKELNKDIFVCCLGDQFKTLDLVEQGKILSSVTVSPEATGKLMVEVSVKLFSGEAVEENTYIPFEPLTKDTVAKVREYKLSFGPME